MDMIRWLATNKVVVAVWGLGILAMLLAWIFGGSGKVEKQTAAVETKVVETASEASKPATTSVTAAVATTATAAVASTVQSAVDTGSEAVKSEAEDKVSSSDQAAATNTAESTDASASTDSESAGLKADTSAAGSEASGESSAVKDDSLADKSSDDLLMMAREAYWDNGLDEAASLYSELITREPGVIEHKGELGNVFWRQGYPKKAAELYADIAEPMIAKGNGERVSNMVGFIGLFFPERASTIRKLLDAQ